MKKWHLWLAASIGLVVIAGMMIREFDVDALSSIDLSPGFFLGVGMAVGLFALQNLMLSLRFQHLCHRRLSLMQSFRVNVLCEFTSAVTPSAVGGSGLAFVYLNREGVTMGRSIFTMFAALLADEAFLAVSCCLLYFLVPSHLLFSMVDGVGVSADVVNEWIKGGVQVVFIVSMLIVAVWTVILYVLLLHRPQSLGWVLKACCKISVLRRFLPKVEKFSVDMTLASEEARQEGWRFWLLLMGYTSLAWLARFAIVVAILLAFQCHGNMLLAWCRQWVMWMISILSPTPGGSGVGVSKQVAVEERTKTNIEIHGGSIIAGSSSGASIGSGNDGAANVMIDGGTIGLKGTKDFPSQCADIGKGQSNSSYAITSVMVKGGSIYMTDVRRNPVLAG